MPYFEEEENLSSDTEIQVSSLIQNDTTKSVIKPNFQYPNLSPPPPQNMAWLGRSPFLHRRSDDGSNSYKGQICSFDEEKKLYS